MKDGQLFNPHGIFVGSFIPNCLMKCTELTSTQKLLWARLAQYTGKDGRCFPQQKTLAYELGISISSVQKALYILKEKKFIKIINPKGKKRFVHLNNEYGFLWQNNVFKVKVSGDGIHDVSEDRIQDVSIGDGIHDVSIKENPIKENPIKENSKILGKETSIPYLDNFPKKFKQDKEFPEIWKMWLQHRKEKKSSITPSTAKLQIKKISRFPFIKDAIAMIENSIEMGYTGLFENNKNNYSKRNNKPNTKTQYGKRLLYIEKETDREKDFQEGMHYFNNDHPELTRPPKKGE